MAAFKAQVSERCFALGLAPDFMQIYKTGLKGFAGHKRSSLLISTLCHNQKNTIVMLT
jgi:hypothetical protein